MATDYQPITFNRDCEVAAIPSGELMEIHADTSGLITQSLGTSWTIVTMDGFMVRLQGKDVAKAVAAFVREQRITQIVFGRSALTGWKEYLYLGKIQSFLRNAPPVDVHIVTQPPD